MKMKTIVNLIPRIRKGQLQFFEQIKGKCLLQVESDGLYLCQDGLRKILKLNIKRKKRRNSSGDPSRTSLQEINHIKKNIIILYY